MLCCGGGDLLAIRGAFEEMKPWCKANGISVIRVWGRQGWERALGLDRVGVILHASVSCAAAHIRQAKLCPAGCSLTSQESCPTPTPCTAARSIIRKAWSRA